MKKPAIRAVALALFLVPLANVQAIPSKPIEKAARETAQQTYGQIPLVFIRNQGQLDPKVLYYTKGPDSSVYFTKEGIVFDLIKREETENQVRKVALASQELAESKARRLIIRQRFVGADSNPAIVVGNPQPGRVNILRGNDPSKWATGIPTFGTVAYKDLYPGIDLVYKGEAGQLKYEFIVKPRADYKKVQLAYAGIDGLVLSDTGNVVLKTAIGEINDIRPVSYQEIGGRRIEVESRFRVIDSKTYGFEVRGYEPGYPLIIDPGLVYSTFIGGNGTDRAGGIAVDADGNAYVSGSTDSSDFPTTVGALDRMPATCDTFVVKLDPSGTGLVYATFLGGSFSDCYFADSIIAVDSAGNAYVAGTTFSSDFPTTEGAFDRTFNGFVDIFVAMLNPTGSALIYSTFLGGAQGDAALAIAVDTVGNAYVTGEIQSSDFPITEGAFDSTFNGSLADAFVATLNPTGSALIYSTFLGGSSGDSGRDVAVDADGNVYVTGVTGSSDFPTTVGAFDRSFGGGQDAFVAKLNPTEITLIYSTFLGGTDTDNIGGIAVDADGNSYVTGATRSPDFPTTPGAFDSTSNGESDAFVVKLDPAGASLLYATLMGGGFNDSGSDIAIDTARNVYITGSTGPGFPTTGGAFDLTFNGGLPDAFVAKLDPAGASLLYATFLGGSSSDQGIGIAVDSAENVYVTGVTFSSDFPTTTGALGLTFGGGSGDAFVTKLIAQAHFTLSVSKAGTGSGTVSSSPVGINCGPDCSEVYLGGTAVTLTAAPDAGSAFAGWTGGGCSGTGPCTVTMTADTPVIATFTRQQAALSISKTGTGSGIVTSSPSGINCGPDCVEVYPGGTVVTLTATPDSKSIFAGWTGGGCTGTGTCAVTMNTDISVVATFNLKTFTLSAGLGGTGRGTVTSSPAGISCPPDCSETYPVDTMVTLTATPESGSAFARWSESFGRCTSTGPCTVLMTANTVATAFFTDITPPDSVVTSTVDGNGNPIPNGGFTTSSSMTFTFTGTDNIEVSLFLCSLNGSPFTLCTSPANTASFFSPYVTTSPITFNESVLTANAAQLSLVDEDISPAIPLPFNFEFFGRTHDTIFIVSNGYMTFGDQTIDLANQMLPDPFEPNGLIAGYWTDLDPGAGGTIKYETQGTGPNRVFIVEFRDVPASGNPFAAVTFQIKLFEGSNNIEVHTSSATGFMDYFATQGIENEDGTLASFVPGRNSDVPTLDLIQDGVRFAYAPGLPSGSHTFQVQAIDLGRNPDPTPAIFTWTIGNTPAGSNLSVSPGSGVTSTFTEVTSPGDTTVTTSSTGPTPPAGFRLGMPPTYYNLTTTAIFSGPITVCIDYTNVSFTNETVLKLFHYENGAWTDKTVSLDTVENVICASVDSLSPFAIFEPVTNLPPNVSQARPSQALLWPPNHQLVSVSIVGVTDPDGDPVTITITQIRQDEPVNGLGDGDTAPDAAGIGTAVAQLRAERSGKGNGRVYTITFEARDNRGGLSTGTVTVGVPLDQGKQRTPFNDGAVFDSTQ